MDGDYPERIICLTDETTETLYLLEEDRRIVGVSGFTVRPPRAREEKPVVTSFTKARVDDILDLRPDLVLGFSDIQAEIARQLIARGVEMHVFNHRSIAGILRMIRVLGAMVGAAERAQALAGKLAARLDKVRHESDSKPRPRVYFEEWDEPIITSIGWVAELIEIAGGEDLFANQSTNALAKDRLLTDPTEVVRAAPDIIISSWCGKPFDQAKLESRPGWEKIPAVKNGDVHAIDSSILLQPGPAALTDGFEALRAIVADWQAKLPTCGAAG